MNGQDEDPTAQAGAKLATWVALAATATEAFAQIAAARARADAERDHRAAALARAELRARYARDRLHWQPVVDPKARDTLSTAETGTAWAAALAWAGDPQADRATELAEDRLRTLHPDEMRLYDRSRAEGIDPVEAMRRVAPLMDRPPARRGDPGRIRPELLAETTERSPAVVAGEAFPYVVDSTTPGVMVIDRAGRMLASAQRQTAERTVQR